MFLIFIGLIAELDVDNLIIYYYYIRTGPCSIAELKSYRQFKYRTYLIGTYINYNLIACVEWRY